MSDWPEQDARYAARHCLIDHYSRLLERGHAYRILTVKSAQAFAVRVVRVQEGTPDLDVPPYVQTELIPSGVGQVIYLDHILAVQGLYCQPSLFEANP